MQEPFDEAPLMTSQYVPSGREVEKVVDQSESALLMATKPSAPTQHQDVNQTGCGWRQC